MVIRKKVVLIFSRKYTCLLTFFKRVRQLCIHMTNTVSSVSHALDNKHMTVATGRQGRLTMYSTLAPDPTSIF